MNFLTKLSLIGAITLLSCMMLFSTYRPYIGYGTSMTPTYQPPIISFCDTTQRPNIGEIATYDADKLYKNIQADITHRVVNKTKNNYVFKGDNLNQTETVPKKHVICTQLVMVSLDLSQYF